MPRRGSLPPCRRIFSAGKAYTGRGKNTGESACRANFRFFVGIEKRLSRHMPEQPPFLSFYFFFENIEVFTPSSSPVLAAYWRRSSFCEPVRFFGTEIFTVTN